MLGRSFKVHVESPSPPARVTKMLFATTFRPRELQANGPIGSSAELAL